MRNSNQNIGKSKGKIISQFIYTLVAIFFIYMAFFAPKHPVERPNLYSSKSGGTTTLFDQKLGLGESFQNFSPLNDQGFTNNKVDNIKEATTAQRELIVTESKLEKKNPPPVPPHFVSGIYNADIDQGIIGVSEEKPLDDPIDNVFLIEIDGIIKPGTEVTLNYEVYGIENVEGVCKSINENYASGGYLVKLNHNWTAHSEKINSDWLKEGSNIIKFSLPEKAAYSYKIRNLKLNIDPQKKSDDKLVIITKNIKFEKEDKIYIKGYLPNYDNTTTVGINNEVIPLKPNGEFEYYYKLNEQDKLIKAIIISSSNGASEFISLEEYMSEPDWQLDIQPIPQSSYMTVDKNEKSMEMEGVKIFFPENSTEKETHIFVSKIGKADIPPLDAGMVNVTMGNKGYRFLPHGSLFKKDITIELAYDEALLPAGYSEKDIQTYFFNEKLKHWEALPKDSIDKNNKMVVSKTNHFTDMINGVIQVPESPQTNAFTPTMMNDIKAADPLANVNMISPPSANQKGTANISYPFKIPAGRMGVQPQLGLQYSNEGGSSYVGYGWSLSMPAITLDTRWGTPKFNPTKETEIYMLNGEQLVYPKTNASDEEPYMPHRHSINNGLYDTSLQERILHSTNNIKIFTPRKKGSFAKIERIGENPQKYCWVVTDENGTKSYYGTTDGQVENYSYIIRDSRRNIVHWALAKVEDKYGNTMTYTYSRFNNMLYPLNINYTGKDYARGVYDVAFKYQSDRIDAVINGRNGLRQVDDRLLLKIAIKKDSDTLKTYNLNYTNGKFEKKLLTSVDEITTGINDVYSHTFEYYDDTTDGIFF